MIGFILMWSEPYLLWGQHTPGRLSGRDITRSGCKVTATDKIRSEMQYSTYNGSEEYLYGCGGTEVTV